jgi:hypothetical protein
MNYSVCILVCLCYAYAVIFRITDPTGHFRGSSMGGVGLERPTGALMRLKRAGLTGYLYFTPAGSTSHPSVIGTNTHLNSTSSINTYVVNTINSASA